MSFQTVLLHIQRIIVKHGHNSMAADCRSVMVQLLYWCDFCNGVITVGYGVGAMPSLKTSIQRASVPPLATTPTSGLCKTGKPSRQCPASASASSPSSCRSLSLLPCCVVVLFCFFLLCFLLTPVLFVVDWLR